MEKFWALPEGMLKLLKSVWFDCIVVTLLLLLLWNSFNQIEISSIYWYYNKMWGTNVTLGFILRLTATIWCQWYITSIYLISRHLISNILKALMSFWAVKNVKVSFFIYWMAWELRREMLQLINWHFEMERQYVSIFMQH